MSNKFSNNLKQKLKMKQLKIKSFLALLGLIMFANIMATAQPLCPPVSYLTATVNSNNSVTLNWTNPPQSQWGNNIAYFRCTVGGTSYNQYFNYFNYTQSGTHTIPASVFPNGGTFTISLFNGFMDGGQQDVCEGVINSVQVTIPLPTPPSVTTDSAEYITHISAYLGGEVDSGTNVIAEKGVEWKKTSGGTYADLVATQTGNYFGAELSGLTPNTNYTFRAYVKVGTTKIYGSELTFTTLDIPVVNMDKWVELTVEQGEIIHFGYFAAADNTPIKIESGSWDTIVYAYISVDEELFYTHSTSIKIYGDITGFYCNDNGTNITGLDASHNTGLIDLDCSGNNISSLDLTGLTALKWLSCNDNNLSTLDLTGLTALEKLFCYDNNLSSLDLTGLTALEVLWCYKNNLSSITTSGCISLKNIICNGNNLSACGLDSLFHQLPRRAADDKGLIEISFSPDGTSNPGSSTCRDTIATNRNWEVSDGSTPIANTTYACPYFTVGIEEVITDNISAKVYPNPVSNDLNIECGERIESLDIYDALGRKVISKENTPKSTTIDVSNLDNGIYILKLRTSKGRGEYKVVVND